MILTMLLTLIYFAITLTSGTMLYIIYKYLKGKPFGTQFVTDHLSADLIINIFVSIVYVSASVGVREAAGPFNEAVSKVWSFVQQMQNLSVSNQILLLQVAHFCTIFFPARYWVN